MAREGWRVVRQYPRDGSTIPSSLSGEYLATCKKGSSDSTASVAFVSFRYYRLTVETVLEKQLAVRLDGANVVAIALRSRDATLIRGGFAGAGAGVDCGAAALWI